jgi:hypothetical protein
MTKPPSALAIKVGPVAHASLQRRRHALILLHPPQRAAAGPPRPATSHDAQPHVSDVMAERRPGEELGRQPGAAQGESYAAISPRSCPSLNSSKLLVPRLTQMRHAHLLCALFVAGLKVAGPSSASLAPPQFLVPAAVPEAPPPGLRSTAPAVTGPFSASIRDRALSAALSMFRRGRRSATLRPQAPARLADDRSLADAPAPTSTVPLSKLAENNARALLQPTTQPHSYRQQHAAGTVSGVRLGSMPCGLPPDNSVKPTARAADAAVLTATVRAVAEELASDSQPGPGPGSERERPVNAGRTAGSGRLSRLPLQPLAATDQAGGLEVGAAYLRRVRARVASLVEADVGLALQVGGEGLRGACNSLRLCLEPPWALKGSQASSCPAYHAFAFVLPAWALADARAARLARPGRFRSRRPRRRCPRHQRLGRCCACHVTRPRPRALWPAPRPPALAAAPCRHQLEPDGPLLVLLLLLLHSPAPNSPPAARTQSWQLKALTGTSPWRAGGRGVRRAAARPEPRPLLRRAPLARRRRRRSAAVVRRPQSCVIRGPQSAVVRGPQSCRRGPWQRRGRLRRVGPWLPGRQQRPQPQRRLSRARSGVRLAGGLPARRGQAAPPRR